mgnify:CR=1 FL=1
MRLKSITEGSDNDLSFSQQTQMIQKLNLSPNEIEQTVEIVSKSKRQSEEIVEELLLSGKNKDDILEILHKIGTGAAFSKQSESLCLLTAINKVCSFDNRTQCVGCKYEIKTKSTMLLLVSEYKRVYSLYQESSEEIEKENRGGWRSCRSRYRSSNGRSPCGKETGAECSKYGEQWKRGRTAGIPVRRRSGFLIGSGLPYSGWQLSWSKYPYHGGTEHPWRK